MVQKIQMLIHLTVATGGRGFEGTTAAIHTVLTGTYSSNSTVCTVTTSSAHNFTTGQRIYLRLY